MAPIRARRTTPRYLKPVRSAPYRPAGVRKPRRMVSRSRGLNLRPGGYLKTETKHYDQSFAPIIVPRVVSQAISALAYNQNCPLFAVPKGTEPNERIGNKVVLTKIRWTGVIFGDDNALSLTAPIPETTVCLAIIMDTMPNAALPNLDDVFDNTAMTFYSQCTRNTEYLDRFKVLWNKSYVLKNQYVQSAAGTATQRSSTVRFNVNKKVRIPVTFNSASSFTVSSLASNALWLVAYQSNNSGSPLLITWNSRVSYIDP